MKLVNRFNLPQPFVDAVSFDGYSKGDSDFTTTGLIKPPRIVALERKYWDVIEEDASERVWRLSGQAKHVILERAAQVKPDKYISEQRFFIERNGVKISGQIDLYDKETQTLYDWKETSVWKVIVGDVKDWTAQANINRFIVQENQIPVARMINIAFFKDWKRQPSERYKTDYPECPVRSVKLDIWPAEKTEAFIAERVRLHKAAESQLPKCTAEERWEKPARFALMVKGRKRAVKLYDSEAEALAAVSDNKQFVEPRPGEWVRCENYCAVAPYCTQFRTYMMDKCA